MKRTVILKVDVKDQEDYGNLVADILDTVGQRTTGWYASTCTKVFGDTMKKRNHPSGWGRLRQMSDALGRGR
jgi:hypothetical protein